MPREKEVDCIAHCPFQNSRGTTDGGNDDASAADASFLSDEVASVVSPVDTTIRTLPMYRKTPRTGPRWKPPEHFHADFKVLSTMAAQRRPEKTTAVPSGDEKEHNQEEEGSKETKVASSANNDSIFLSFEAMATEGIAVALSPQPKYTGGTTYEIFYGDRGNTQSLLERRRVDSEKIFVALPGRHCTERQFTAYWIAMYQRKVYAGVGNQPPNQCLGVLDDSMDQSTMESTGAWYVGMGNSSMHRKGERPLINHYRNIRLSTLPTTMQQALQNLDVTKLPIINLQEEEMDDETKQLLKEYEQECEKAKVRAEKFGLPYKQPPSFLPWSKLRRLQASAKDGFATGLDLQNPAEKAKQEARRKRFGIEADAPLDVAGENVIVVMPVTQAWDKEKLVRRFRTDPPRKLWKVVPDLLAEEMDEDDTFSMHPTQANLVPDKIHLFAIDWAAFLQIRTNDLTEYFSLYSPTYVEWLGDLSCNIHFQDKFSAARALENLSQEIPTPPPPELERADDETVADLGAMGWRFGKTMLRKVADDRFGRRGTTARVLLRLATTLDVLHEKPSSAPKPPPGFSRNRVLGPDSDGSAQDNKGKRNRGERKREEEESNTTLNGEPSLLSGSLKASRSGFSAEELEAERAKKRAKTLEEEAASDDGAGDVDE